MTVELIKENIKFKKKFSENTSSVMLKEDFIISDTNPDVSKIIGVEGKCKIYNKEAMNDKVYVEGEVEYNVIYLAEVDDKCEAFNCSYSSKFTCYVQMPGCNPEMEITIEPYIEHIMATVINERKVCVEAVLEIRGKCFEETDFNIVKAIDNLDGVQYLNYPLTIDKAGGTGTHSFTNNANLNVPMDLPQIGNIISAKACVCKKSIKVLDGRVSLEGSIKYNIIYKCKNSRDLDYMEKEVPFSLEITLPEVTSDMYCKSDVLIESLESYLKDDDLGESRIMEMQANLCFNYNVIGKTEIEVIDDAYCPESLIDIKKVDKEISVLFGTGNTQSIVKDNIEVNDSPAEVISIVGKILITDRKVVDDRVVIEGIIKVCTTYKAKDDKQYVGYSTEDVPFSIAVDIPGAKSGMEVIEEVDVENIEGSIEANTISVKILLTCNVGLKYTTNKEFIEGLELHEGIMPKKASVTIYVVQSGDTLWKIAKKYNTTVDKLMEVNEIDIPELIKPGDKIIIEGRAVIV